MQVTLSKDIQPVSLAAALPMGWGLRPHQPEAPAEVSDTSSAQGRGPNPDLQVEEDLRVWLECLRTLDSGKLKPQHH
jgi:hypothetical protein